MDSSRIVSHRGKQKVIGLGHSPTDVVLKNLAYLQLFEIQTRHLRYLRIYKCQHHRAPYGLSTLQQ
ncbi:hypothetical protein D3C76_1554580 [compost metagenome]